VGAWYLIHLDGGTGRAMLRRWDGGSFITDDTLVADLHPAYYADPVGRLVNAVSMAFTPATTSVPAEVTIDPPDTFVGTLRVDVTVSDGSAMDLESFSVQVNAAGGLSLAEAALAVQRRSSEEEAQPAEAQSASVVVTGGGEPSSRRRASVQAVDEVFEDLSDTLTDEATEAAVGELAANLP
jgi:hypothetical protein